VRYLVQENIDENMEVIDGYPFVDFICFMFRFLINWF